MFLYVLVAKKLRNPFCKFVRQYTFKCMLEILIRSILRYSIRYISRRDGVVVRASASQSVDVGVIPYVESYQKTLKNGIHSFPAWRSAFRGRLWRTSRQVRLLCPWARHLTGRPTFMWKTGGP